jgi:glycosyltransferase involved in cell wall biosynthesis
MNPLRIYQILPSAKKSDAVGSMALNLQHLFGDWGAKSLIFTESQQSFGIGSIRLGPLRRSVLESGWGQATPPDIAIYHHSIGTKVADAFLTLPASKKILVYHNVTPPDLIRAWDPKGADDCVWGLQQNAALVAGVDCVVALSKFSMNDLAKHSPKQLLHIPYLLGSKTQRQKISNPIPRPPEKAHILVVGRVVPHKCVLESIRGAARYLETHPDSQLRVVGGLKGAPLYVSEIQKFLNTLSPAVRSRVQIFGRVSPKKLIQYYRDSDLLLTLSKHEGFCVPIVEAMQHHLAIVASQEGAIPETLGEGGLLVSECSPQEIANFCEQEIERRHKRYSLLVNLQNQSLRRFESEFIHKQWRHLVDGV